MSGCVLLHGFNLGRAETFVLLSEWNKRCQPPWSDKELHHKVESADKQAGDRGYLLKTKDSEWASITVPDYQEPPHLQLVPPPEVSYEDVEREAIQEEGNRDGHSFIVNADGLYRLTLPEYKITMDVDRLRRESNELVGELCVRCTLPGVRSYEGALSIGDLNLSSVRARAERARILATRTNFGSKDEWIDWLGILEEFCQRVLLDERKGQASFDLREMEPSEPNDTIKIAGIELPRRHPTILFGDGGGAKSYTALYMAGLMAQDGINVALFDWELAGEDHRERLERLFPMSMPKITYARCERPLVHEVDRLRRIVAEENIEFSFFDSIAFACSGPPEAAEIAGAYFRAVRQIGGGSLHIAHVSKAEGADQKPFGSAFWHNGARATWYVKATQDMLNDSVIMLGLFNRKANLARVQRPVGFRVEFGEIRTYFTLENVANTPELAEKMSLTQRMREALKKGPLSLEELANLTASPTKRINEAAKRNPKLFIVGSDGKVANLTKVV